MPIKFSFSAFHDFEYYKVILLLSAIAFTPIKYAFSTFLTKVCSLDLPNGASSIPLWVIFICLYVFPFLRNMRIPRDGVAFFFFLLIELVYFWVRNPEETDAFGTVFYQSVIRAFPYYIVARSLRDYDLLKRYLFPTSIVINICMAYVMYVQMQIHTTGEMAGKNWYSMYMAYQILPGAMLAFYYYIQRWTLLTLGNMLLSALVLFSCGTRGALVCYGLFCVYEIVCHSSMMVNVKTRNLFAVLLVGMAGVIGLNNDDAMPLDMISTAKNYGISTRIIRTIDNGTFSESKSRTHIYEAALDIIAENPILGVGLLEGRKDIKQYCLMNVEMSKTWKAGYLGTYSHMAFLDWMIEFGCLFGGFVIVGMLFLLWRAFFVLHGVRRFCLTLFAFSGFLPLMFSGVWYQSELFFIFLGCSVSNYYRNNVA